MQVNNNVGPGPTPTPTPNHTYDVIMGEKYAGRAIENAPDLLQERVVIPVCEHLYDNGYIYLGIAAAALIGYTAFRWLASKGETQPMPVREYRLLTLQYEDGTVTNQEIQGPITIQGAQLQGLTHYEARKVDGLENHVNNINQLHTREDIVAWLITYQHLTCDGNGKDIVRGTAAAGLAAALRGAMAGRKLKVIDDSATIAFINMLKELRTQGQLPILNSTNMAGSRKLQEVETKHHRLNMHNYDAFGKRLSELSPEFRAGLAYYASGVQGLPKAAIGLTKMMAL